MRTMSRPWKQWWQPTMRNKANVQTEDSEVVTLKYYKLAEKQFCYVFKEHVPLYVWKSDEGRHKDKGKIWGSSTLNSVFPPDDHMWIHEGIRGHVLGVSSGLIEDEGMGPVSSLSGPWALSRLRDRRKENKKLRDSFLILSSITVAVYEAGSVLQSSGTRVNDPIAQTPLKITKHLKSGMVKQTSVIPGLGGRGKKIRRSMPSSSDI